MNFGIGRVYEYMCVCIYHLHSTDIFSVRRYQQTQYNAKYQKDQLNPLVQFIYFIFGLEISRSPIRSQGQLLLL